ncbi:VanZ family protein [Streptomyces sp. NPDC058691]|uniref:VanZ family protein n=1 Tax=Streptomyces sp. NPDC058691 TaxID=3346601 RepID=UPI0036651520
MALAFVAMVAFGAVLARATLSPSYASTGLAHANLHPGASLRQYYERYTVAGAVRQVGGNVLLGMPFGVLLPVLAPKARGALRVVATTGLVMVLVELAQGAVVQGRAFDVDDVIMNTTGALLGYLIIGRRLGRVVHAAPKPVAAAPEAAPAAKTAARKTTPRKATLRKAAPAKAGTASPRKPFRPFATVRRGLAKRP